MSEQGLPNANVEAAIAAPREEPCAAYGGTCRHPRSHHGHSMHPYVLPENSTTGHVLERPIIHPYARTPEDAGLGGPSADGDYDNIEPNANVEAAIADFENRRRRGAETTAAGEMYGDHVRAQIVRDVDARYVRIIEQQRDEFDRLRQENARLHTLLGSRNPRRENWLWWPIEVNIVMGRRRFLHGPTQHGIAHINDFKPGGPINVVVRCWNFGPFCIVFGNDARARRIAGISAGDTPEQRTARLHEAKK